MTQRSQPSALSVRALCAALLFLAGQAGAQAPAQQPAAGEQQALPAAREIVDRFLEVTNYDAQVKAGSQHIKGRAEVAQFGIHGPLELWAADGKHLLHVELGGVGKAQQGYDGSVGWLIDPMMGPMLMEGAQLLEARIEADVDAPRKDPELYESIRTVARAPFQGQDCFEVEVVVKPLPGMDAEATRKLRTSTEYYDASTGRLAGRKALSSTPMGEVESTTVIQEYKQFGEFWLATKSEQRAPSATIVLTVDSVEFGSVDPAVFALPPAIATLAAEEKAGEKGTKQPVEAGGK
jgi:hypothetical protein